MQSCYIGGSLQSLQGRAGIHNRPTVLTMPPIHLMQNDVLDLTNRCRRRMKTPCRRSGRTVRHRNCNVKLDDLRWDRPDLDCELQQARGIPSQSSTGRDRGRRGGCRVQSNFAKSRLTCEDLAKSRLWDGCCDVRTLVASRGPGSGVVWVSSSDPQHRAGSASGRAYDRHTMNRTSRVVRRLRIPAKSMPASRGGAVHAAICGQLGRVGTDLLARLGVILPGSVQRRRL